jgi:signal transduction histidine kinase
VATGAVLALTTAPDRPGILAGTTLLLAYTLARTLRPLPPPGEVQVGTVLLVTDLAVALAAVLLSGAWNSPFIFTLLVGVLLAGFARGYAGGLAAAAVASAGLALAAVLFPSARTTPEAASQVALVYAATGVVAGFARRLFLEAEAGQAVFADRMATLTEANSLLSQLTRVAQTLPSSLDLGDTLAAAMGHLRQLFEFTGATILVSDAATGTWRAEAAAGLPAPPPVVTRDLPRPARRAAERVGVEAEPALDGPDGPGFWADSRSGLYGPLVARGRLVALVAIENTKPAHFGAREVSVLAGLAEPLALAIDNGLSFDRLRMLGADAERDRLARNLHDRIGQGLAYVGLELDRLSRQESPGAELVRLRQEVGSLLAEVRETLRQLRTRVTDTAGLADLAGAYLPRFAERTGLAAHFVHIGGHPRAPGHDGPARLPVPVEQELWRILQEALSNVERHARATTVDVTWTCDGSRGRLDVSDDGCGFQTSAVESGTSGIMAMSERANSISARLVVDSSPGRGTLVAVEVEV